MPQPDAELVVRVYRAGRCTGKVAASIFADGTAQSDLPWLEDPADHRTGVQLLNDLRVQAGRRDVQVLSLDLAETQDGLISWLEQAGFERTHDLLVLAAETGRASTPRIPDSWRVLPYDSSQRGELAALLAGTQIDTLDFPSLLTNAPPAAALQRIEANCLGSRRQWSLYAYNGRVVGCSLLAKRSKEWRWELKYMGLVPEARGRGGGVIMAQNALWSARQRDASELVLGVDAENDPAVAVYSRIGFLQADRRRVYFSRPADGEPGDGRR